MEYEIILGLLAAVAALTIALVLVYKRRGTDSRYWMKRYELERIHMEEKIESVRKEAAELREKDRKEMEERHENERKLWDVAHENLRRELETRHENDRKEMEKRHENDRRELVERHENDRTQWDGARESMRSEMESRHEGDRREIEERHEEIRSDMATDFEEQKKIWHLTYTEMQEKLAKRHEDEKQALEVKYENEMEELETKMKKKGSSTLRLGDSRARGVLNQILGTFALLNEYKQVFFLSGILGSGPVDLFGVKDDSLDFIEIKSAGTSLSKNENLVKRLIRENRVRYRVVEGNLPKSFEIDDREITQADGAGDPDSDSDAT